MYTSKKKKHLQFSFNDVTMVHEKSLSKNEKIISANINVRK